MEKSNIKITMKNVKILLLVSEALKLSAVLYLVLLFFEFLKAGVVSNYVDLNILLLIVIGLAVGEYVISPKTSELVYGSETNLIVNSVWRSFTIPILLAILSMFILGTKLSPLGFIGIIGSVVGGITIATIFNELLSNTYDQGQNEIRKYDGDS